MFGLRLTLNFHLLYNKGVKNSKSVSEISTSRIDRQRRLPLAPTLAILAIFALGSLIYWQLQKYGGQKGDQEQATTAEPEQPRVPIVAPPPEERIVYAYAGRVTSLDTGAKTITLQTTRGEKQVLYTPGTTFLLTTQPSPEKRQAEEPDRLAKATAEQSGSETDIAVDTTIVAQSDENIRGKDEFTAIKITIIK